MFITSLVANANNGENATYSVTLTGSGKITRNGTAPSNSGNSGNNNSGNNNSGNSNNGDIITYGQASYNNNVTINGTSYNVAGGSVSVTNSLRSISITGSNMNFVYLHYGSNNEAELSINNAGTSASWSGTIYSTVQVYHGNGDNEDPEDKLWFTIEVTGSGQLVDDPDGD